MSAEDFAIEDFKLALTYLQGQFARLWQRFNFFLTVQLALFGFFGWLVFEKENLPATGFICWFGIAIAALWYVVAAQDRALVEVYRKRVEEAAKKIARSPSLGAEDYGKRFIGAGAESQFRSSLIVWYWRPLSITILPVWIALFLLMVWGVLLAKGFEWFQSLATCV